MGKISFTGRWREELVATSDEGVLIFEFPGHKEVYMPMAECWKDQVPAWAKDKWEEYKTACSEWCAKERLKIFFVHDSYVSEEKRA
ncbi:MAG: hypothetical protein KA403_08555 [Candidatus Omnitrophica bacterium]|nr:hypothetical protein [Candidatus Omnitrophota bacterium]